VMLAVREQGGAPVSMAARFLCFGDDRGWGKEWGQQ
jgi:hypothetical protein